MRTSRGKLTAHSTSVIFAAVSLTLLLAVAAACGGDGDNQDGDGASATPQLTVGAQLQVLDSVRILRDENDLYFNLEDVSADGRQLLFLAFAPLSGSGCGNLVRLALDGQLTTLAKDASQANFGLPAGHALFSPQGDRVAYLAAEDCAKRDLATLRVVTIATGETAKAADEASRVWSWTSEGKILFDRGAVADSVVWEVSADGSALRQVATRHAVDVSQDGRLLVYVESGPTVVFDAGAGSALRTTGTPPDLERRFLSPDGRRYVSAVLDKNTEFDRLELYDLDSGAVSGAIALDQLRSLNAGPPFRAAWSSDSAAFFFQGTPHSGDAPPPAYALGPDGGVLAKLTIEGGALAYDLTSRGPLVFYRSGNDIWVAILTGEGIAPEQPEALKTSIRNSFPAPVPLAMQ